MAGLQTSATVAARKAGIAFAVVEYEHETIFVSAGRREPEVELAPTDVQGLTAADTARPARG